MSKLDKLKKIVDSFREDQPINIKITDQSPLSNANQSIILELLILAHNLSIQSRTHAQLNQTTISTLEQLTIIVSRNVTFPHSVQLLARLDKIAFLQYCKSHSDMFVMIKKVYGLYPLINLIKKTDTNSKLIQFDVKAVEEDNDEVEEVGNVNWLLTRQIITHWLQKKGKEQSQEIILSGCILLGRQQLINLSSSNRWNSLWSFLYLYLNKLFLQIHSKHPTLSSLASWSNHQNSFYQTSIMKLRDSFKSEQQIIIFNLVVFIMEEYIKRNHLNNHFEEVVNHFETISILKYQEEYQYMLSLELMDKMAVQLKHQKLHQRCWQYMANVKEVIKRDIPQSRYSPELKYYIPHIYQEYQVLEHFKTTKDDFWNFSLEKSTTNKLAEFYLNYLQQFPPQKVLKIFQHHKNLLQSIFNCESKLKNIKSGQKIIATCQLHLQQMVTLLSKEITQRKEFIKDNLKIFIQQWKNYYQLPEHTTYQDRHIRIAHSILDFQYHTVHRTFQSCFIYPQNTKSHVYSTIIEGVVRSLRNQQDKKAFLRNSKIMNNISQLQQKQGDKVWSNLCDLMIQDEQILQQLMALDEQQQLDDKQKSFVSQAGLYDPK